MRWTALVLVACGGRSALDGASPSPSPLDASAPEATDASIDTYRPPCVRPLAKHACTHLRHTGVDSFVIGRRPVDMLVVGRNGGFDVDVAKIDYPQQRSLRRWEMAGDHVIETKAVVLPEPWTTCVTNALATTDGILARSCGFQNARVAWYDDDYVEKWSSPLDPKTTDSRLAAGGGVWLLNAWATSAPTAIVFDAPGQIASKLPDLSKSAGRRVGSARCNAFDLDVDWQMHTCSLAFISRDESLRVECGVDVGAFGLPSVVEWPYADEALVAMTVAERPNDERIFTVDRKGNTTMIAELGFGADRQGQRFWAPTPFGLLGIDYTLSSFGTDEILHAFIVGPDGSTTAEETFPSTIRWWSIAASGDRALLLGYDEQALYAMTFACAD